MRGGISWQIMQVFERSCIFEAGESKHLAKEEARAGGASTWHDVGKSIGIYSFQTAETYLDTWHQLARFCKAEGLRDIEKITPEHVRLYLESKIDKGVAYATYQKEASALQKFEQALNRFSKSDKYHFADTIKEAGKIAKAELQRNDVSRLYANPKKLVSIVTDPKYKLSAQMQLEGGCRIAEIGALKTSHLGGLTKDKISGETKGIIKLDNCKGGKDRDVSVSMAAYERLQDHMAANSGKFTIRGEENKYRSVLKDASEKSGQSYQGSHGLRWSFAHARHSECMSAANMSYEQALSQVSHEMGHERSDITCHYLR